MNEKHFDFGLEGRLKKLDPSLHKKFTNMVFSMQFILKKYQTIFPYFTDHSSIHSLNVIEFCNKIVATQLDKLNADEIYILLLAGYLHDTGMGMTRDDYIEFTKQIDFKDYFLTHNKNDIPSTIRNFHHEYSGLFVKKYAHFFELPSEEHMHAVIQVCRGHRKVDLLDEIEYPVDYLLPNGNTVCLPYLSAVLRLADEVDVTAARNCLIDVDYSELPTEMDLIEFMKHDAVHELEVTDKEFIMKVKTDDENIFEALNKAADKMQLTLDTCRHAVNNRTKFEISQEAILIERIK